MAAKQAEAVLTAGGFLKLELKPDDLDKYRTCLLGMPVHAVTFDVALELIIALARHERSAYVVTPNVDHVIRFHRRPDVRSLYQEADLVVADGLPLVWASRIVGRSLPERVAGSDLFPALCAKAADLGLSVFFLGGSPGSAQKCSEILGERHPKLRVAGTYCPPFGFEKDEDESERIVMAVRDAKPDLLFVGLGSPKQENWIVANRERCGAGLSIGVGISFSFVCGDVTRAPRWMQRIGLEWFHRLLQEPGRLWKRYLVEDTVFFWLVMREFWRLRVVRRKNTLD